jgi:hypothetical protein
MDDGVRRLGPRQRIMTSCSQTPDLLIVKDLIKLMSLS